MSASGTRSPGMSRYGVYSYFENEELARDETFFRVVQMQRDIGVDVRTFHHELIPEWLRRVISDFILFDKAVSYETTQATGFRTAYAWPAMMRTMLSSVPSRIRDLDSQFGLLWQEADPGSPSR